MNEWISVKKRLPELKVKIPYREMMHSEPVYISCVQQNMFYVCPIPCILYSNGNWYVDADSLKEWVNLDSYDDMTDSPILAEVVAWMPMLKPYTESAESVAESILRYCGMGLSAEMDYEDHVKALSEAISKAPKRFKGHLKKITDEFSVDRFKGLKEAHISKSTSGYSKRTEFDTAYEDIALWIMSFPNHIFTDFCFDRICEDLEASDPTLRYYLSDAVDNSLYL